MRISFGKGTAMKSWRVACAMVVASGLMFSGGARGEPAGSSPAMEAGKEAKITWPAAASGYYTIYLPSDWTPDRAVPVVMFYHGTGGKPMIEPIKGALKGKTFAIVGMDFTFKDKKEENQQKEVANLKAIAEDVGKRIKVEKTQMFLGGFSQGGWWTSMLGEYTMDAWAGLVITGSGEHASKMGGRANVRGKPVYVGVGEKDSGFLKFAQDAAASYTARGASVTLEVHPGVGHSPKASAKLREFLLVSGPGKGLAAELLAVDRLIAAKKTAEVKKVLERLTETFSETPLEVKVKERLAKVGGA